MGEICYKVVRPLPEGNFASAIRHSKYCMELEYRIGETTKPIMQHSKIFVFKTKRAAQAWARGHQVVMKGIATGVTEPKVWRIPADNDYVKLKVIREFWNQFFHQKKVNTDTWKRLEDMEGLWLSAWIVPTGTTLCSTFTPTEVCDRK